MRKFWKDYADLCKTSGKFYKKHWLGCVVLNIVIIAIWFRVDLKETIKETIKDKFEKKNKEEESE